MREILFKAKLKNDNGDFKKGDWVEGDLVRLLLEEKRGLHIYGKGEVIPETVCQFTGLCDRNGNKIFEGDVLQNLVGFVFGKSYRAAVKFIDGEFKAVGWVEFEACGFKYCEVIGNIFDNPELLKEDAQ